MVKIISAKLFLVGFISLALGILFLFIPGLMMSILKDNSAYFRYEFFIILGFLLITAATTLIISGFIDLIKKKIPSEEVPEKSSLRGEFSVAFILVGIILIPIFYIFALASEGGPWTITLILFFGIILLTIGIMLRLRK